MYYFFIPNSQLPLETEKAITLDWMMAFPVSETLLAAIIRPGFLP